MIVLIEADKGDLFDILKPLNGFPGCYDYPYVYFDLEKIKTDFKRTNV